MSREPRLTTWPDRALLHLLFVLSGATALCYEVAWTRHLVLLFGNTTRAVAVILAAYMLGLALGSAAGGRLADRIRRPAVAYAAAEALIGLYALAFAPLVGALRSAWLGLGTAATPALLAGAFLVLLVPTTLMGATLPLLVRASVRDAEATGGVVGRLYGANIVGAVLGTAVTGFWLMEAAGVMGATRWAALVNVAIGVAGWLAFRGAERPSETEATAREASHTPSSPAMRAALVSAFSAGLVGLAAQVVWTRLLVFTLQGFTYTFSAMLATFLLGLALGGFAFARVAARTRDPVRALTRLHAGVGVLCAAVLLALTFHHGLSGVLWDAARWVTGDVGVRRRHVVQLLLASGVVLLPPAFLMGGCFPLAAAAYRRGLGDLGARIGRLYAVNTLGAVAGSLLAGFALVPAAGLTWGAAWAAFLSIGAAAAVRAAGGNAGAAGWRAPALGAAAVAALLAAARPDVPFLLRSHAFAGERARECRLVETRSGEVCQVSVVENERERYRLLFTDEFEAAGTKPEYRYMRLLAHLPVALAEDPARVLVICFGTGTTAGSVSTHPCVKRLDVVEISPEVLDAAPHFRSVNRDVLRGAGRTDLDVAVHVDDGRNFVLRSQETWGVVTLEPLMPYTPAAIHLYTEDFYREVRPRLAPGGLMCQWIPLQGMSGTDFKRLVAAFVAVFPDSAVFFVDGAVALVGGDQPFAMPYARVAERLAAPGPHEDLAAVGFDDPVRALATFVAGGETLRRFVEGVEPVTDERPVLEFHPIPPSRSRLLVKHLWENLQAMRDLRAGLERLPVDSGGDADLEARLYLALRAGGHLLEGQVALETSGLLRLVGDLRNAGLALQEARTAFERAASLDASHQGARNAYESIEREFQTGLAANALEANDLRAAETHLRRAVELHASRQEDVAWTRLATTLARAERFDEALEAATEATRLHPRGLEARAERAFARAALGDAAGAREDYLRALEGAAIETLPSPRLVHDAERVLRETAEPGAPPPLAERVARALAGDTGSRLSAAALLAIDAADAPGDFAALFEETLAAASSSSSPPGDRVAAWKQLETARPRGTADAAVRALADPATPAAVARAAAGALARADARRLRALLVPSTPAAGLAAAATAAGASERVSAAEPLLALLSHADADVRRAAQVALFSLLGDEAPGLGRLDVSAASSRQYREGVLDLRAWWARERDRLLESR